MDSPDPPEQPPSTPWRIVAFLVLASLMVGIVTHNRSFSLGDDGNLLMAAKRVGEGEVPFVDFVHYFYSPGRVYLAAGLFELTGVSYLALRWMWVVVRGLGVLATFFTARRFVPDALAAVPAVVVLLVGGPWFKSFYGLCSVLAVLACLTYTQRPSTARAAGLGAAIAAVLFLRQDVGLIAVVLAGVALVGTHLKTPDRAPRVLATHAAATAGTAVALLGPFLATMAVQGALWPMLDQLYGVSPSLTAGDEPVKTVAAFMRRNAYQGVLYGTPLLAALLAAGLAARGAGRVRLDLVLLCLGALGTLLPAYTAPGLIRFYQAHHLAWVLVVAVSWRMWPIHKGGQTWRRYAFVALLPTLFTADALVDQGKRAGISKWSGVLTAVRGKTEPALIRGQTVYVSAPRDRWIRNIQRFVRRHTHKHDHVLFLPSGSLLNHACNRANGTRYIDVWAYNYLENPIAQDITASYMREEFDRADPALVFVRDKGKALEKSELGHALEDRGYAPYRTFGPYTVFVRPVH